MKRGDRFVLNGRVEVIDDITFRRVFFRDGVAFLQRETFDKHARLLEPRRIDVPTPSE